MSNAKKYCIAFSHFLGIGPVKYAALLSRFGTVKDSYEAPQKELEQVIGMKTAARFVQFRRTFDIEGKIKELERGKIKVLCLLDDGYPVSLKNIPDPPICLYIKGNTAILKGSATQFESEKIAVTSPNNICFAIVGTRKPTPYGQQLARKFSAELSQTGLTIISGMAIGIDTIAHHAALDTKGKTIAVLGCGVNIIYPAINRFLYEKIFKSGGAVVSEFPPDQTVEKGLFICRNRIISGLSHGVMIVEGGEKSGALITAKYAAIQGKDVFAPPGPINSKNSIAPNILLKQGAKLVTETQDILDELNIKMIPKKQKAIVDLGENEFKIYKVLEGKPMPADELSLTLGKPINEILNTLSLLEIKGAVEKNEEGKYQIIL